MSQIRALQPTIQPLDSTVGFHWKAPTLPTMADLTHFGEEFPLVRTKASSPPAGGDCQILNPTILCHYLASLPPTRQSFSIFTHSWKYDTANHLVWPKPGTWPPPTFYLQQSPDMRTPLALFCNNSPFTLPRRSQTAKSNSLLCLIDEVGSAFSKLQTSETFAFRCWLTAGTLLYPVSLVSGCWDRWSSQKSKYQYKDHLVGY